ncbi:phage tail fiber protein [Xenorhabdus doucetiae]|nr:hypothetical protein [Xenorhabdus doucetiae]
MDANALSASGWYSGHGAQAINFYNKYAPIMVMTRTGGDGTGMIAQIQVDDLGIASRYRQNNRWSKWSEVWSTGNTTKDGNGFLRASSPIIQIHPDGTFTTNDESEGATVAKLGTGHYQVSGVLGYNADGAWGVHGGIPHRRTTTALNSSTLMIRCTRMAASRLRHFTVNTRTCLSGSIKFIIYQSPLKMLDFLSKPDHACNHENSSDTRTKTCPRIDA